MNFITVLGSPETVCAFIEQLILSGAIIWDVKKSFFNATYLIGYEETVVNDCFLALEDGSLLLLENGSKIVLEVCPVFYMLLEDGSFLLLEDGSKIELED
jgi:hypothetical protein